MWQRKAERTEAHILVGFPAYVPWKKLAGWPTKASSGSSRQTMLEELGRKQGTDVVLPLESGQDLRLRHIVPPDDAPRPTGLM